MPKRKRGSDDPVGEKLAEARKNLTRALKVAKGHERQRLSKRLRESEKQQDAGKKARHEREIAMLKTLDLTQTADAHLISSLLRVKGVAEAPRLPQEVKRGVAKPESMAAEDRTALHNVTSALFGKPQVLGLVDKAVREICAALGVDAPNKKAKGKQKPEKTEEPEVKPKAVEKPASKKLAYEAEDESEDLDVSESEDGGYDEDEEQLELSDDAMEAAIARFDSRIGNSSDSDLGEDSGSEEDDELDPDEISDLEESSFEGFDDEEEADAISVSDASEASANLSISVSPSPPPSAKQKAAKPAKLAGRAGESMFLPSLMGGYISGSGSEASDIDVAPPRKNRRGQRARQAIWEKRYKAEAKHVVAGGGAAAGSGKGAAKPGGKGGAQTVWDPKRGAVDSSDMPPWMKRRAAAGGGGGGRKREPGTGSNSAPLPSREAKSAKPPGHGKDDQGPLHPSWIAAKKKKEMEKTASFQGKKITFD